MTTIDPATCWAPVPVRWRYVQPGDVLAGKESLLVVAHVELGPRWFNAVLHGYEESFDVDPDELVQVLVPIPERDAQRLSVEQLGAVVVGRRMGGAA